MMMPEYIAGFFDGEGCVGFVRTGQSRQFVPRAHIVNTNREILEELQKQFGGDIRPLSKRRANWKQGWIWRLTSRAAINFLSIIEPHLILKQNQVMLVLGWDAIRPGRARRWDQDGKDAIALLVDQMHWLNQKGPQTRPEPMMLALSGGK